MVSFILPGNSASGEYEVANSCRFNNDSSDFLNFETGDTTTSATKSTLSAWVKRTAIATNTVIFGHEVSNSLRSAIYINTDDNFLYFQNGTNIFLTNAKFRDTSAWYHFVVTSDLSLSTASDRVKLFINGVRETSFSQENNVSQNASDSIPNFGNITVGANRYNSNNENFFDGYMAEVCFLDGQALDADQFGEFDSNSNIWKPKDVSGLTFGNNGFYLDFENSSSLGNDAAGSNNFTVNNLTSIDQSTDTCTNNFATMNPLVVNTSAASSFAEGGLQVSTTDSGVFGAVSTIGVSSGKWYWEVKPTQIQNKNAIGVTASVSADATNNHRPGDGSYSAGIRSSGDAKLNGSSESGSWDSFTTSDIVGVALDLDNNKLYFSKNGTFMNSGNPTSGSTGTGAISLTDPASTTDGFYFFAFGDPGAGSGTANIAQFNFGSPPYSISSGNADANGYGNFEYSVPSGYYALNTKNLAEYG